MPDQKFQNLLNSTLSYMTCSLWFSVMLVIEKSIFLCCRGRKQLDFRHVYGSLVYHVQAALIVSVGGGRLLVHVIYILETAET